MTAAALLALLLLAPSALRMLPVHDGRSVPLPSCRHAAYRAPSGEVRCDSGLPLDLRSALLMGVPIDVNTADARALERVPGIGPSLSRKIIEDRTKNGPFASVDELDRVHGVGPKLLRRARALLSAGPSR